MATVAPGQLTFLTQSKLSLPKLEVMLTLATQVYYHFYSVEEAKGDGVELVILSSTCYVYL